MVALEKAVDRPHSRPDKRELYREFCQDNDGVRYTVIVWQNKPGLSTVSYSLEDGTPLHYEDECDFALPNGKLISRCED